MNNIYVDESGAGRMADIPKTYSATVSHDLCVGIAMCMQHAPGAFDFDDEGLSVFQPNGEWTDEEVEEAADGCPTSAIRLGRGGPDAPAG
jgi:ferredoxin